jgi:hypothetical protein
MALSPSTCDNSRDDKNERAVRFSPSIHVMECETPPLSQETSLNLWWTVEEMSYLKHEARELCATIRKTTPDHGCAVATAHEKTSLMLNKNLEALVQLSPSSPEQDLFRWGCKMDGRRGLERFASKSFAESRRQDVQDCRNAVLNEQQRQREKAIHDQEVLAKVARESTRRARTFALFFGEADSLICRAQQTERRAARRARLRKRTVVNLSSRSLSSRSLSSGSLNPRAA